MEQHSEKQFQSMWWVSLDEHGPSMTTWIAFFLALIVVIFVHEMGHYLLALYWRVRVLRFSMGFGKPLFVRKSPQPGLQSQTEFTVNAIPLGGYVKFQTADNCTDDPFNAKHAFDSQPLLVRTSIVLAGPVINLLLALLLYAAMNWMGYERQLPQLSSPPPASLADQAGLSSGDLVTNVGLKAGEWQSVESMEQLHTFTLLALQEATHLYLQIESSSTGGSRTAEISLLGLQGHNSIDQMNMLGIQGPRRDPMIANVLSGGVASKAGLLAGDKILLIDGQKMVDAAHVIRMVRAAKGEQKWEILRANNERLVTTVKPEIFSKDGRTVAKIDAVLGNAPATIWLADGFLTGLGQAAAKVIAQIKLTVIGFIQIFYTSDGWKQLGGPFYIADIAGKSAAAGLHQYLGFLAIFSLSIGVLNLMPIPMLDGGHLLYYMWEAISGKPVSALWQERLGLLGMATIFTLIVLTFTNDFLRWIKY